MTMPSLEAIRAAREAIRGHLPITPVFSSTFLASESGAARLFLKCESLQKTGSFKVRGALHAVTRLDSAARARGVVTVSAGNHAQALAWSARSVGVRCTVVMPKTASESKAAASAGYGAEVIRHGTAAEAFARAHELAEASTASRSSIRLMTSRWWPVRRVSDSKSWSRWPTRTWSWSRLAGVA